MEIIAEIWNQVIIRPMVNSLVILYDVFFDNFGLSIIVFTLIIRAILLPVTLRQSRQMKILTAIQPRLKEIQAKYGNDRQRLSQETLRVYKEHGINPLGCLGPMVIQFPIWIGLYQAIFQTLPSTPERLADLSRHLYAWIPRVHQVVPLDGSFLWMDLARPDPSPFILPVLVAASMWMLQKMTTMPTADPRQESTNRMFLWFMPIMFGWFTLGFPSGLAIYWIVSNVIGVIIQGFVTGWGPLLSLLSFGRSRAETPAPALVPSAKEAVADASHREDGQDAGRGHRARPKRARRGQKRGRNRRR